MTQNVLQKKNWSHSAITGLSNEQIVAELKWTEKAIFDVIGVSPIYYRPPYGMHTIVNVMFSDEKNSEVGGHGYIVFCFSTFLGEVDARVRAIATQLGFKTSIWTHGYDTNDVRLLPKTMLPFKQRQRANM